MCRSTGTMSVYLKLTIFRDANEKMIGSAKKRYTVDVVERLIIIELSKQTLKLLRITESDIIGYLLLSETINNENISHVDNRQ